MTRTIGDRAVLACPHCRLPLAVGPASATCESGHFFDRARDGSLNLVVGGRLRSAVISGDTAESLAARRRFLDTGAYAPIAALLAETVGVIDGVLLDVGCGEGYYTAHLAATHRYGIDVSKKAVQLAARRAPEATFVVASAYRLPVLDASVDVVTCVFAPRSLEEFTRVLRPGGHWVTVTPGPRHLEEMRPIAEGAAGVKALERRRRRGDAPAGATVAHRLERRVALDEAMARDLFTMTPVRWQQAARPDVRDVTVDVWVASGEAAGP